MKKKIIGMVLLSVISILFSSCNSHLSSSYSSSKESISSNSSSSLSNSTVQSSSSSSSNTSSTSSSSSDKKGYYQADTSSFRIEAHPYMDTFSSYSSVSHGMPSTGNVNILVFPVYFSGTTDTVPTSNDIDVINKAYFGAKADTGWESLASYYETSSYGKLHIGGSVTEAYKDSRTSTEFMNASNYSGSGKVICDLISDILVFNKIVPSNYDSNNDGFIDAVELVYFTNQPLYDAGGDDIWWAFTSITNEDANLKSPNPSRYFWSPFSMISDGYYTPNIDTHTLVHETGHAMGLNDYYSYDSGDESSCPIGGVDMMDFNIGDHNAYSKMVLGWANPLVIDGSLDSFSMTLHSFADTGEFILLRDTKTDPWNGMPYDEYLILQYYTSTSLNEKDSTGYPEWVGKAGWGGTYKTYGLQVFHVDSRIYSLSGTYDPETMKAISFSRDYVDTIFDEETINEEKHTFIEPSTIAASNTKSKSRNVSTGDLGSSNRQISIIPANKNAKFMTSNYYSSVGLTNNLFGKGSDYGSSTFSMSDYAASFTNDGSFDDGSTLDYSFAVTANDASSCTLSFSTGSK